MNGQLFISLMIVALAVAYIGWRVVVLIRGLRQGGCAGGCGCSSKAKQQPQLKLIAPEELTIRRR